MVQRKGKQRPRPALRTEVLSSLRVLSSFSFLALSRGSVRGRDHLSAKRLAWDGTDEYGFSALQPPAQWQFIIKDTNNGRSSLSLPAQD